MQVIMAQSRASLSLHLGPPTFDAEPLRLPTSCSCSPASSTRCTWRSRSPSKPDHDDSEGAHTASDHSHAAQPPNDDEKSALPRPRPLELLDLKTVDAVGYAERNAQKRQRNQQLLVYDYEPYEHGVTEHNFCADTTHKEYDPEVDAR